MNAQWNAPISGRFSSLCARVFSSAAAILESEKTLGTRLENSHENLISNPKVLKAFPTTFPTEMKPAECPATEKNEARKGKKRGGS